MSRSSVYIWIEISLLIKGKGVEVITKLFSPFLRHTPNLAQRSFKVIHFGGNRKPVYDFIYAFITFALSSTVSEILPALYAQANCVSK